MTVPLRPLMVLMTGGQATAEGQAVGLDVLRKWARPIEGDGASGNDSRV